MSPPSGGGGGGGGQRPGGQQSGCTSYCDTNSGSASEYGCRGWAFSGKGCSPASHRRSRLTDVFSGNVADIAFDYSDSTYMKITTNGCPNHLIEK